MEHDTHDHHRHDTEELDLPAEDRAGPSPAPEPAPRQRTTVYRSTWSPAQMIALAGGIFFVVLGGIALARGGLQDLLTHVSVGGFHHTSLLGLVELTVGLLMLAMGAIPGTDRSGMIFMGSLLLAFGIVVGVQGESFHAVLGTHSNNGWLYVLVGTVLLIAALVAPIVLDREDVYRR